MYVCASILHVSFARCFLRFPDFHSIILCFESCASSLLLVFVIVPYIFVDSCDVGHHFCFYYNSFSALCYFCLYLFPLLYESFPCRFSCFHLPLNYHMCCILCVSIIALFKCLPITLSVYSMLCVILVLRDVLNIMISFVSFSPPFPYLLLSRF